MNTGDRRQETEYGFHIIKVTEAKEAGTLGFDEVKAKILQELKNQKKQELAMEYVTKLNAAATIVYPPGKEPTAPSIIPEIKSQAKPENKPAEPGDKPADVKDTE